MVTAILGADGHAVVALSERNDLLCGVESDARRTPARVQQDVEEIGTIDQGVGIAKLVPEFFAQRYAGHLFAADRIKHDQVFGEDRKTRDRLGQAELLKHPEDIGSELDAGADFVELGRLLEQMHGATLARK